MTKFKTTFSNGPKPESPEALFRDLRGRSPAIRHLWSHQADVLRAYHTDHLKALDIALQLPTGSGKTLVGLLVGEYRRLANDERVVYMCPTRQLAYQVGAQAQTYGIKAHILVGPQSDYDQSQYSDYVTAKAIAVTTYSGVFNSNPKLGDAHVLVLDDAHAADNYVADLWTVSIDRRSGLYRELLELLSGSLPTALVTRYIDNDPDPSTIKWVDKVPIPFSDPMMPKITELFDANMDKLANSRYAWVNIRGNLHACCIYVSWAEIVLRPVIPPSRNHPAFASAVQRVYMSATLGQAGDLERMLGVPKITRVPIPAGWDKQAIGRRLMLFPDRSFPERPALDTALSAIATQNRSLVLCPDKSTQQRLVKELQSSVPGYSVLGAESIESTLDPFVNATKAVLILTSRYDGLDLPDDKCRLSVVYGLPNSTNIQEKFLWSRLNATALLRERIRTRLMQAFGRCTRNDTDYAAVMLIGQELFDFCAKSENTTGMHPEIRAEIQFGIENSEGKSSSDQFQELLTLFFEQGEDWAEANEAIVQIRTELTTTTEAAQDALATTVSDEVEFGYALWSGDYGRALVLARSVTDRLSGDSLKGYRGWWYYLAGAAAWLTARKHNPGLDATARDMFLRGANCAPSIRWLVDLAKSLAASDGDSTPSGYTALAVENLVNFMMGLGLSGGKFEKHVAQLHDQLNKTDSKAFEMGLEDLGRHLGFQTIKPDSNAAPDAVWYLADRAIVFEAKSDATTDSIPVSTLRQAKGHYDWIRAQLDLGPKAEVVVVIVTSQSKRDRDTDPFGGGLYYLSVDTVRELARSIVGRLRECRSMVVDRDSLSRELLKMLLDAKLSPDDIWSDVHRKPIGDLES